MSGGLHSDKDELEVEFAQTLPVDELNTYQLGLLLKHGVSLEHVVPRTIDLLTIDPFVKTESSVPGSLLRLLLSKGANWLDENKLERERLEGILYWVRIALQETASVVAKFDARMEGSTS